MKDLTNPEDRMLALLQRISSLPMMSPPKESPISMPQAAMLEMVARDPGCGVLDIAKQLISLFKSAEGKSTLKSKIDVSYHHLKWHL